MEFYLVDVKDIFCTSPNNYSAEIIEQLAQSILEIGLTQPLILKQIGLQSYGLLAGELAYFAAVRAKEINPRKGEMIQAFVIGKNDDYSAIQEQLKILA